MKERDREFVLTTVCLSRVVLQFEADVLMLLVLTFLGSLQWNRCFDMSLLAPMGLGGRSSS